MKKHGLIILTIITFFFCFGIERPVLIEKTNTSYLVSNDTLVSPSEHSNSECELISNQISNTIQANKRTHSLVAYLIHGSLKVNSKIAVINIEKGLKHFSHKTYLLHNYPSHNLW